MVALGVLVLHFYLNFYGLHKFGYLVSPGDDTSVHLELVEQVRNGVATSYPSGLHHLVLWASSLLRIDTGQAMALLLPILLVTAGVSMFLLTSYLFGGWIGVAAYSIYTLVSLQPQQTGFDGGLPNLLGGHVILPILLIFYVQSFLAKSWTRFGLSFSAFIVSLVLLFIAHHLSTLIGGGIIAVSLLPLLIVTARQRDLSWRVIVLILISIIAIGLLFLASGLLRDALQLGEAFVHLSPSWPFIQILNKEYSPVWLIVEYSRSINGAIFQLGFLGLILVMARSFKSSNLKFQLGAILISLWLLLLFLMSRQGWTGEPGRLARDLALPASILAGFAVVRVAAYFKTVPPAFAASIFLIFLLFLPGFVHKEQILTSYNLQVRFTPADRALVEEINANPTKTYYLLDRSSSWRRIVKTYLKKTTHVVFFERMEDGLAYLSKPGCIYLALYDRDVWFSDGWQDNQAVLQQFRKTAIGSIYQSNPVKTWYRFCSPIKKSIPKSNLPPV